MRDGRWGRRGAAAGLLTATLCASCGRGDAGAAPVPRASAVASAGPPAVDETAARAAALAAQVRDTLAQVERLATLHRDAVDCDALTATLTDFAAKGPLPATAPPEVFAAIDVDPALAERLHRALEPVMTASMKCRGHAAFEALHARLRAR